MVGLVALLAGCGGDTVARVDSGQTTSTQPPAASPEPTSARLATPSQTPALTSGLQDGRGNVLLRQTGPAGDWYCEAGGAVSSTVGQDEVPNESSPRDILSGALIVAGALQGRADEVIGPVTANGDALLGQPVLELTRSQTNALGIGGQRLTVAVLLLDPARPENKPAGDARLSFSEEMGWNIDNFSVCSSAQSGSFTPYELPSDEKIAEQERTHLEDLDE